MIGAETSGLRLTEVLRQRRRPRCSSGQVLARIRRRHGRRPTWRSPAPRWPRREATLAEAAGQRRARARSCRPAA
ncbi:MAG: hypothetical protein MZV49_05620 [Rhodopseudomonas palustris]|nr:hypothetical protein [Rhodopseudomonas palustris]